MPNVENFSVDISYDRGTMNDEMFNVITKGWTHLKYVKLSCRFVATKHIFDQLMNNCKVLKTVEITEKLSNRRKARKQFWEISSGTVCSSLIFKTGGISKHFGCEFTLFLMEKWVIVWRLFYC